MCGIAGILCPPAPGHPLRVSLDAELRRLAAALHHRGPDARDVWSKDGQGLAHTRLAILDLSPAGAQPMASPDGRYVLVYNGEVYNFRALRGELEQAGERFAGRSDTEVVLRMLAREGPEALGRLDGMFALALLDTRSGELMLARDRMGQKPLYYAQVAGGGWAFASEVVPLLRVPGVDRSLSPRGLSYLLTFGMLPAPFSLWRGLTQLRPGSLVHLAAGRAPELRRWSPEPGPRQPPWEGDLDALSGRLEEILATTIKEHLVSDVPLGVLLSGGVDSSTVAALAARHVRRLKTFSVVHRDPVYDERLPARAVAAAIGSEHHEIELSDSPLTEEELDCVVDHHGDPFADSSSLMVLRISREMRRHVTVALSGDGGDELFAGYPRFGQLRLVSALARAPGWMLRSGERVGSRLFGRRARQVARTLRVAGMPRARRAVAFGTLFWPEEQRTLLQPEWCDFEQGELERFLEERGTGVESDPVAAAHWMEQRLILPDDMLTKVDRMSMAASLEVRPPLLGGRVLDFAERLPFSTKHRAFTGKRILRNVARRMVPSWVIDRPKKGFALPLATHGGAVLAEAERFALEAAESPLRHLFRPEALRALARSLRHEGEGSDPEDSPFRRDHRRWVLALLARALVRHGGVD